MWTRAGHHEHAARVPAPDGGDRQGCLATIPTIIVFDEPTSSLTEEEVEHLFRIINMLRDRGCGIIYISHKMEEILRISDEVTVMRDGAWVATRAGEGTDDGARSSSLMVGRELTNRFPPKDQRDRRACCWRWRASAGQYIPSCSDVSFHAA